MRRRSGQLAVKRVQRSGRVALVTSTLLEFTSEAFEEVHPYQDRRSF